MLSCCDDDDEDDDCFDSLLPCLVVSDFRCRLRRRRRRRRSSTLFCRTTGGGGGGEEARLCFAGQQEEEEEEERIQFAGPKPFCSAKPACFKSSLDNSLTFSFLWHLHLPRSGVDLFSYIIIVLVRF